MSDLNEICDEVVFNDSNLIYNYSVDEISRRNYKEGYTLIKSKHYQGSNSFEITHAENPDGNYIGDSKTAHYLCVKRGIKPDVINGASVCSIGFCESENKWYGWSHRAINGFGIGDSVVRGDCAYVPSCEEDEVLCALDFWGNSGERGVKYSEIKTDEHGKLYIDIEFPDSKCSEISGIRHYLKGNYGKGEWVANTLDDAKQMAIDFAESVG